MCGRMNVSDHPGVEALLAEIGVGIIGRAFNPRYNVAPTSSVLTVSMEDGLAASDMHWGIIPAWAKPGKFANPLINARSETIWEKPSFRELIRHRRVLIPVNGFYEWRREDGNREAFYVRPPTGSGFFFGGIASISREGEPQCCIVTTAANETMAQIHHRMPVILSPENSQWWLKSDDVEELDALMRPAANDAIELVAVSNYVNSARNEGPRCLAPKEAPDEDSQISLLPD